MAYPPDTAFRSATIRLLGSSWKKLPRGIERARLWGADWFSISTPFVHKVFDEIVAHVGVIDIPMVVAGQKRSVAGIHAVCTHADHRRRGYLRQTMQRALAWVDAQYDAAVLWANDPAIYTRFGFVTRAESTFQGPISSASVRAAHPVSLEQASDVDFLGSRLIYRAPVSTRCGSREPGELAFVNLALWSPPGPDLDFIADLDCIVVYEVKGRILWLYDVIAPQIPELDAIVSRLGCSLDGVVVCFSPDELSAPQLVPTPTTLADFLMVRGTLFQDEQPMALSPLSRC